MLNKAQIIGHLGRGPEVRYTQDGTDRYTTEIVADQLRMLGGRNGQDNDASEATSAQDSGAAASQPTFDDDVPF